MKAKILFEKIECSTIRSFTILKLGSNIRVFNFKHVFQYPHVSDKSILINFAQLLVFLTQLGIFTDNNKEVKVVQKIIKINVN